MARRDKENNCEYYSRTSQPWIFFVEGAITVVVAVTAFFFLPNTPGSAKFLTPAEQLQAAHGLHVDLQGATASEHVEEERFSWTAVKHTSNNLKRKN